MLSAMLFRDDLRRAAPKLLVFWIAALIAGAGVALLFIKL